jgi:hypothetical protein
MYKNNRITIVSKQVISEYIKNKQTNKQTNKANNQKAEIRGGMSISMFIVTTAKRET